MKKTVSFWLFVFAFAANSHAQKPRIVNIVNFIRLLEPRDSAITEDVLYQTVVKQLALMRSYHLPGTFLLQYDALMDTRYQKLLKSLPKDSFEIGAWWEIPQPLVENSGMKWRGRYPWDWRANVGFATGYTPEEREKLVDTYMHDFKKIFGYYPQSVASWFIDAHSLLYMYEKYHIVASANCKDQYGTDGYTLWGGYWNQAYYPSKLNAYMPAQHQEMQIPVPVFRMLGSDPIRQYDNNLDKERQGVVTLEPVYENAGGDSSWVYWFFKQLIEGPCMSFAYTQAGQENSFTWPPMAKGLNIQFSLIARLRAEGKLTVEKLATSGKWFKDKFLITPATSVTATAEVSGMPEKSIWFDSRFYRANLLWDSGHLRFRDIHIFDEYLASLYLRNPVTSNDCRFFTLPVVDGYLWSTEAFRAGLRFVQTVNGKQINISGAEPAVSDKIKNQLTVTWPLENSKDSFQIIFKENRIEISLKGNQLPGWKLDFSAAPGKALPFVNVNNKSITSDFEGMRYETAAKMGHFESLSKDHFVIIPEDDKIVLSFLPAK